MRIFFGKGAGGGMVGGKAELRRSRKYVRKSAEKTDAARERKRLEEAIRIVCGQLKELTEQLSAEKQEEAAAIFEAQCMLLEDVEYLSCIGELLQEEGYIAAREKSGYFVTYRESDSFETSGKVKQNPARTVYRHVKSNTGVTHDEEISFNIYAKTARRVLSEYGEEIIIR